MANIPPWLATMREIDGTHWAPGDGPNSTILEWLRFVSSAYPNMADYCASVMHDEYFSWCGMTVGYCMAKAGIAPVFGAADTSRFLWAAAWLGWGTPVATPQPGDVLVFDFGGGDHHVTLFESDNGNGTWACRGGNQSHRAMVTNFSKSKVMGIRRASAAGAVVQPTPAPVVVAKPPSMDFNDCIVLVLRDEGGNDDDPRDPGGRTSRGILQREWDVWRQTHPGLPSDVWQAPQDQIIAIYHQKYWDALNCDSLPAGVDYAVFDYGVNSGIGRAAKVLQGFVGSEVDGEIGPQTITATTQADPATLVTRICDERLAFLQGLGTWATFGRGWTNRVQGVRRAALAMASAVPHAPPAPPVQPTLPVQPAPPVQPTLPVQPTPPVQPIPPVQPTPPVQPAPPTPVKPPSKDFVDCVALVLRDEGGNDDDPRDPGGRTSRGILQREWDVWRQTHPGQPSDVWQAPQDQIVAIYREKYWDALCCDSLPAGVDYAVFDYGVNSGIIRSAKVLQGLVGADIDGEIGPQTIAATAQADPATLVQRICDERLTFLQGLGTWPTFGNGWTNRVQGVRRTALAMASAAPPPPVPRPVPPNSARSAHPVAG